MSTAFTSGFSLIELLIALALMAILASIALPTYTHYTKKAYFSEIIQAALPYQLGVEACYQWQGTLAVCNGGQHDIPPDLTSQFGNIASLVTRQGKITVTPEAVHRLSREDTYVLQPIISKGHLIWQSSGGGVTKGYGH